MIRTLGELKDSGYQPVSVKDELRRNLLQKLQAAQLQPDGAPLFPGIVGYETTVLPQVINAILSRHDILLLGRRGQAKSRLLRGLVTLLDEVIPVVAGSEINDDPLAPISRFARERIEHDGDATPIDWLERERRYQEKLATPDVTMADLIGDVDLIKHAAGRHLSDELTIHFGLVPRCNRGIFCLNELPDLAPKIQVGLFNLLEERDVQIRGYPVRLDLDVCLAFSANPEDYTNRGRIVTPLKDRIGSVIRTHYPLTRDLGIAITDANVDSKRSEPDCPRVFVPLFMKEILEEVARLARSSTAINQQSGVSVRLSLANRENLESNAERRAVQLGETAAVPRLSDLGCLLAGSRGKIELSLGDDDGPEDDVIAQLTRDAIKVIFAEIVDFRSLALIESWFATGNVFRAGEAVPAAEYERQLTVADDLRSAVEQFSASQTPVGVTAAIRGPLRACVVEFLLEGLHLAGRLKKSTSHAPGEESVFGR